MAKIQKGLLLRDDYSKYYVDRSPETGAGTLDTSGFIQWQLEQDVSIISNFNLIQDLSIYVTGLTGVTQLYVDGSLAERDASINQNIFDIDQLDASIIRTDIYQGIQDISINNAIKGAINVGDGSAGVYAGITSDGSIRMRELVGVGAAAVFENVDTIEISIDASFSGEVNTASNIGDGIGIFSNKVIQDLEFKSLGSNIGEIIISTDASNIYLDVSIAQDPSILFNLNNIAQLDSSIIRLDAYDVIQDVSIALGGGVSQSYVDSSLAQRDISINYLYDYNAIQDISIAALSPTEAWNALTKTDNSIGLGGEILSNIDIYGESRDLYLGRKSVAAGAIRFVSSYTIDGFKAEASIGNFKGDLFIGSTLSFIGRNEDASVSRFQLSTAGMQISDSIHGKGVTYFADYSPLGGSDPRWIPDNEWVHTTIDACSGSGVATEAWQGLTKTDNSIGLGGTINQDTSVIIDSSAFDLMGTFAGTRLRLEKNATDEFFTIGNASTNLLAGRYSGSDFALLGHNFTTIGVGTGFLGVIISDADNFTGAYYNGDYAATQLAGDRWIPDWGAVTAYVDGSLSANEAWGGLTKTDNSIGLGGTLLEGATTIRKPNNSGYQILKPITGGDGEHQQLIMNNTELFIQYASLTAGSGNGLQAIIGAEKSGAGVQTGGGLYMYAHDPSNNVLSSFTFGVNGHLIVGDLAGTGRSVGMRYDSDYSSKWSALTTAEHNRIIPDIEWIHTTIDACAGSGSGVSQAYVDSSLAERDVSINYLYDYNAIQDVSIVGLVSQSSGLWVFDSSPGPPLISTFGRYVKTGVQTLLTFRFTVPADASSGTQVYIGNLPFLSEDTSFAVGSVLQIGVGRNTDQKYQMCKIAGDEKRIQFHDFPDNNPLSLIDASDYNFVGSITYITSDF